MNVRIELDEALADESYTIVYGYNPVRVSVCDGDSHVAIRLSDKQAQTLLVQLARHLEGNES